MNENLSRFLKENPHCFTMELTNFAVDKESRMLPMTFFKPYLVTKWWGNLKLLSKPKNVDLSRWKQKQGVPFLMNHNPEDQRGMIFNGYLKDDVLGGDAKFSRNPMGEELMNDVMDELRPYSSVGFEILNARELPVDEMNDEEKNLALKTEMPIYEINLWKPVEGSSVWMGEIPTVGTFSLDYYDLKKKEEIIKFSNEIGLPVKFEQKLNINSITKRSTPMKLDELEQKDREILEKEAEGKVIVKLQVDREAAEKLRKEEIEAFYKDWKDKVPKEINLEDVKNDHIKLGRPAADFSEFILNVRVGQIKKAAAKPTLQLTRKELEGYSLSRGIAAVVNGEGSPELDISQEYAKLSGNKSDKRGSSFYMPHSVLDHNFMKRRGIQKFATDVNTTATTGGEFVGTDHIGGEWIDALRSEMILDQLGMRMLPGRKGNIEIPKLSAGNTFGWAATENAAVTEGDPATTEITMTPKRGGFFVDISKTAIIQSDPALDVVLNEDGRQVMGLGFQAGVFHGSGAGGQFTGIQNLSAVNNSSMASASWQKVLAAIKEIKSDKAALGLLTWVTNATGEAVLRGRTKETGYPVYLLGDDDRLAGRAVKFSESISNNGNAAYIFLGAFNQAYYALWDALDITVDMLTLATTHQVRITFNQLADFNVRHHQSFWYANDLD